MIKGSLGASSPYPVLLALCALGCSRPAPPQAAKSSGPVTVNVSSVGARDIQRVVDSVGTLFPYEEVIVSAEIEGRVDEVRYDLGDAVRKNDVLVRISDEEQRYILAQNEAQLRQSLERLGLRNETDRVSNIDDTPEVRRARADLQEAEMRHRRLRSLVDQHIGAQADLDAAASRLQAMQAAYDSSRNQTRNLIQEVERFKALVELQRKKLRDTSVRAPFDAIVNERQVNTGQYVRPNAPLFALVKINPLRLRLEVPERLAPWTRNGQAAAVSMEAYPDREFRGRVWRISPTVDQTKRTFIVEVLIDNPDHALKPGSYARARLTTQKTDRVVLAPAASIAYVLGSNKAFVVAGNGKVQVRDVKTGDRFGSDLEILEGLEPGERVATSQLTRLDTGIDVTVAAGDAKPDAATPNESARVAE